MPEKGKTFAGEVREETVAWSKDTYQLLKQAEQGKVKSYVQDIALKKQLMRSQKKLIINLWIWTLSLLNLKKPNTL
ncbi:hypothetical protein FX583_09480 [Campylobacter jejuni]|nr:hypothetical protein [Campylobacter jejuni]ECO9632207.1 hypothetical protein [Campylobacter jejuni]EDO8593208.1 hypothetical protein [Campylobacter jejuni]EDO8594124.1 hypothetical protein [Campylobacter jejuni]